VASGDDSIVSDLAELTVLETRRTIVDTSFVSGLPTLSLPYPELQWTSDMIEVFPDGRVWLGGFWGTDRRSIRGWSDLNLTGAPTRPSMDSLGRAKADASLTCFGHRKNWYTSPERPVIELSIRTFY